MSDKVCGALAMLAASYYDHPAGADGGVKIAHHEWVFSFKNLSSIRQTVRIILLPGTAVTSMNSRGDLYGTNDGTTNRTARAITEATTLTVNVQPNGYASQGVVFEAGSAVGAIMPIDAQPTCNTQPGHRCMLQTSIVNVRIEVDEDRGAVTGNLSAGGHRCYGMVDTFVSPPFNYPINGGRPF